MAFKNKVVLVTGASSGIGKAIAIKFSKESAKLVIIARNTEKLEKVSRECEENGSKPLTIIADITKEDNLRNIVDKTLNYYGKIDVLVNNAGVCILKSILSNDAIEVFDKTLAVNLRAVVILTHMFAPHLIKNKGNIVNISSAGSQGIFFTTNFSYCVSKAGVDHFTKSVALELATKGVRVNSVNPGPVKTDFIDYTITDKDEQDKFMKSLADATATGKVAEPEEIADVVLFLASDKARSITGSSYIVDNGMLLKGLVNNGGQW